jgi:hypothetical protein
MGCKPLKLAFDKSTRSIDADGRLHVGKSHISKSNICPYIGKEIPGYEALGLDPDKIYNLFRDPAELKKAASTFARLPILKEHVPVTVDTPQPDLVIGAIGSDVSFDTPYLDADLCFWDAEAIAGIETGDVQELSCAYRYVPVMEPGEYEGKPYDGRMTQIQGNHVAKVENGRAGPDVVVGDSNPFKTFEVITMKMTKLGKALFAAFSAVSPKLAQDSALPALVGEAKKKTFDKKSIKEKLIALDAALKPEQLDNIIGSLLALDEEEKEKKPDSEKNPNPTDGAGDEDETEEEKEAREKKEKEAAEKKEGEAEDEEEDDKVSKKEVKEAMDSLRKDMREASEAARDVRPIVGDVIGMDSAAEVYGFALDHMKIDRKDVTGTPALRALFKVASAGKTSAPVHVAQDSAGLATKFPNATRFSQA